MKKKTTKKASKQKFKLPIAGPFEIEKHLFDLVESDVDLARQQLWCYWLATTKVQIAWGGPNAVKDVKKMIALYEKEILGKDKRGRK